MYSSLASTVYLINLYVYYNRELFKFNPQVHKFNTRSTYDQYYPQGNLTRFKKGICYMGVLFHLKCRLPCIRLFNITSQRTVIFMTK
jgi:hypothetical protein